MSHWSECVNEQLGSTGLADVRACTQNVELSAQSPIDAFYISLESLLAAGNQETIDAHPVVGQLIVVGMVSATESYLRGIFSEILKICSVARKKASEHSISFGSILWYGEIGIERSAFEHVAFSSRENIEKAARNFIAFDPAKSPLKAHLDYFDEICQLRHCIVHSGGYVQGKNAVSLELTKSPTPVFVSIGYAQLQEIAAVCSGMVRAFNTELFKITSQRWANDWRKGSIWNTDQERDQFKKIWNIFLSKKDRSRRAIAYSRFPAACCREIKKELGV